MKTLVLMEHDGPALRPGSRAALGFARELSEDVTALVLGEKLEAMTAETAKLALVLVADHPTLAAPQLDRVLTLRYRPRFDQIWLPYQRLPEDRDQHGQS